MLCECRCHSIFSTALAQRIYIFCLRALFSPEDFSDGLFPSVYLKPLLSLARFMSCGLLRYPVYLWVPLFLCTHRCEKYPRRGIFQNMLAEGRTNRPLLRISSPEGAFPASGVMVILKSHNGFNSHGFLRLELPVHGLSLKLLALCGCSLCYRIMFYMLEVGWRYWIFHTFFHVAFYFSVLFTFLLIP